MGVFGLFKNKKKSSKPASAPEIADLPPIPEPDSSLNLPPSDDLSDTDLSNLPSLDLPSDLPEDNSSLNDSSKSDSLDVENPKELNLSDLSPDHPLPNLSPEDLNPSSSDDLASTPPDDVSLNSQESDTVDSENKIEDASQEQEEPVVLESEPKPSLPVFKEVAVPNQIDEDSLTISALYIKQEQYGQVLETLHNTQKELDALVKKSALAKPNEKIGMLLKKSTAKHADLNKGLMFVEEHLIE